MEKNYCISAKGWFCIRHLISCKKVILLNAMRGWADGALWIHPVSLQAKRLFFFGLRTGKEWLDIFCNK